MRGKITGNPWGGDCHHPQGQVVITQNAALFMYSQEKELKISFLTAATHIQ